MQRVTLTIDGKQISVRPGTPILKAARSVGASIPTLCHLPGRRTRAVCRICVVAVQGSARLVPACATPVSEGMQVDTQAADVVAVRRTLMEFILAEHRDCGDPDCQIEQLAAELGVGQSRFHAPESTRRNVFPSDFVSVLSQRCVHCDRCIEACAADRNVLARSGHGATVQVDFADGESSHETACSVCGDCVSVCPAGGLIPA